MSSFLQGRPRSQFSRGHIRGTKSWSNAILTGLVSGGNVAITTNADQVACVDRIILRSGVPDKAAAATQNISISVSGMTMTFAFRQFVGRPRPKEIVLVPKGTMWVKPSSTLTFTGHTTAGTETLQTGATVQYRMMTKLEAIANGYTDEFWATTSGNLAATTRTNLITAATVTANRGMEINGIVISGHMPTATSGTPLEILLEFTDGSSTHHKIIKGVYNNADPDLGGKDTIISNCKIRGPKGYGLAVTAGATGQNVVASAWGKYYTDDQKTWPGTGAEPGASATYTGGDYFWVFSEDTASGTVRIFPETTLANSDVRFTLDGFAAAASEPGTADLTTPNYGVFAFGTATNMLGNYPVSGGLNGTGIGCSTTYVLEDVGINGDARNGITGSWTGANGTASKVSLLMWGRIGRSGEGVSSGNVAKKYSES